jgi:signal transduction histidine kinase/ligand-binding sensor domain-containing protein
LINSNSFRNGRLRSRTRLLAALAIAICPLSTMYAIDPDRAMSQYVHDRWSTEQGFPKGPVYAIAQTRDGYLWIGTEAGLIRFDGWTFQSVRDESGAFTIASVLGLTADDAGCLWVRSQDLTILRYCHGVFERPSFATDYMNVSAMSKTTEGQLLMAKMEEGAFAFRGGKLLLLASAEKLPRSPVTALAQTPDGDVWMGTRDAGLFRMSGGTALSIRQGLPDLKVNCLLAIGDRDLWVGTDNGIVRWDGKQLIPPNIPPALNRFQALVMTRDRDGNIWVGTDSQGLLRLNSRGVEVLKETDTRIPQAITALYEGREGGMWIGHADGIERLRDSAFVSYSAPEGLPTDGSNPVFVDSQGRMWFSPVTGGLWWVKGEKHGRITDSGLDRDVVYSIAGNKDELWVGRQRGGLTRLRLDADSITAQTYTQANGLAQDSVYSVYVTRDGTVWAGTLSAGVSMLRDGKFTNFTTANGLASNTVASILESSGGTMWFATPGGLSALSKGRWQTYESPNGLPSDNVDCLFEDSSGLLWAGTESGLAYLNSGKFQKPVGLPAPLQGQIFGLAEDKYGWLWIATSDHILRINRDKLWKGALDEGDLREYGMADGLRGVEGVKRHKSVITDSEGRIWISLNRGISVVDPARLTRNSAPAIVHIQALSADNSPIRLANAVHIPGGHQRITFAFSGLILSVPDRVRYRYRLEGFDTGWSQPEAVRQAVYTNLPPGHYRFRVVATNPDGIWSADEAALAFQVEPLFWQTWWFELSIVAAILASILAIHRIHMRQFAKRINVRFQERLAERTRIAQELHDTLLQGFLSVSMQVHVATDRLPDDSAVKPTLNRALELMRQVIEEGRNAVRGLRSSQSASLDLEQAFSQIQEELSGVGQGSEQVDFRVIVDGERRPLHPVLRDEVYRIGREALINAFRHAQAKKIELELKYSSRNLCMLVRDNGCGIDPAVLETGRDGHWGLSGIRERADRIGAQLHVMSSASAGTEIELSVPGNVAYQGHSDRTFKWFVRKRPGASATPDHNGKSK